MNQHIISIRNILFLSTALLWNCISVAGDAEGKEIRQQYNTLALALSAKNYTTISTAQQKDSDDKIIGQLQLLMSRPIGPKVINHRSMFTLLGFSIRYNRLAVTRSLLEHRASPDLAEWAGETPLKLSIAENNLPAVQLLLHHKATIGYTGDCGHVVCSAFNKPSKLPVTFDGRTIEIGIITDCNLTPIEYAFFRMGAKPPSKEIIQALISAGADTRRFSALDREHSTHHTQTVEKLAQVARRRVAPPGGPVADVDEKAGDE